MHYGRCFKIGKLVFFYILDITIWVSYNRQRHFTLPVKSFVIRNTTVGSKVHSLEKESFQK